MTCIVNTNSQDRSVMGVRSLISLLVAVVLCYGYWVDGAIFTIKNNCPFQIWPATLTGTGSQVQTGFQLAPQASRALEVPAPWSGRFWARFQCSNAAGKFTCQSGDCNSGRIECSGAGGTPPVSLVEVTLAGADSRDFYDISLVDGFNLPVSVKPDRDCPATSCPVDINNGCPNELAVRISSGAVVGCKSACAAFNQPQYCCTGAYSSPATCRPTNYSQLFKGKCPQAYSYAYDDRSSLTTCPTGGNYLVTFCP